MVRSMAAAFTLFVEASPSLIGLLGMKSLRAAPSSCLVGVMSPTRR